MELPPSKKLKIVTCLGWCDQQQFMQTAPFERYCPSCKKIKSHLERTSSRTEISAGGKVGDDLEIPDE